MGLCLALDVMGGDHGPGEIVPAALHALTRHRNLELLLVGREQLVKPALAGLAPDLTRRLRLIHAPDVVSMDDAPSAALRNSKNSSMRVAVEQVKSSAAQACVSAGNTGALMAISRYVLKMLPGIDRPAICTVIPGINGHTHILDLGANVDSSAEQLFQFAVMGVELTSAAENIAAPKVGLLNVGTEENKGNDRIKQAASLLSGSHLNYIGFVEGNDIYSGDADVIVCDGFVGNIALKASEGVAQFFLHQVRAGFGASLYGRVAALVCHPVIKSIRRKTDPRRYNGASLLGLRSIVIKSHGSADRVSFAHAIEEALLEVKNNIPERITVRLEALLTGSHAS
ncbi:MAG: phosphate acyltransferase PlsX [Gammaproteobacteria bacterium]|nr:phosphate acyltransferase PlsX [Gammaproteobacteria bacterium]MCY4282083.1 phosphate acyltransferase PlsX [Gammaproteobacteria bacterium]MCY4337507.1 phosphate acyltransferase PlsX [Gammaproteobacteria bacterium]